MQYHALNEHLTSTCTEKSCIQNLLFCQKNLEAKKKAKKIKLKKKHWSDIFFTKKTKKNEECYIYIYFREREQQRDGNLTVYFCE